MAANADFAWHTEKDARNSYLAVGANPIWVQPKACFVWQRYADRDRWMAALVRARVPVDIFGPGWGAPNVTGNGQSATHLSRASVYLGRRRPAGGISAEPGRPSAHTLLKFRQTSYLEKTSAWRSKGIGPRANAWNRPLKALVSWRYCD